MDTNAITGTFYPSQQQYAAARALTRREFSPRQLEVLMLLCEGLSNKHIGLRLNIAPGTVKIHVSRILSRLGVTSRLQAALVAQRGGLIGPT